MQAYPFQHKDPTTGLTNISTGMTLRDYFAAQAMQSFCSSIMNESRIAQADEESMFGLLQSICATAYITADAMMEARK